MNDNKRDEDSNVTTLHGTPIDELREMQAKQPVGQHSDYIILTDEERAKGFIRQVRDSYKHVGPMPPAVPLRDLTDEEKERYSQYGYVKFESYGGDRYPLTGKFWTQKDLDRISLKCGATTTMGRKLSETYARDPGFYGSTFCCSCNGHFPVGEFIWTGTNDRVGS